jgi:DNA invertase Pin-like site-specific DNA recombinase
MLSLEAIISGIRRANAPLTDDDLRRLPFKKAFIYGRVSTSGQVKNSRESIKDVAKLFQLAKQDGYRSNLDQAAVEKWLEAIQNGEDVPKVLEDQDIIVNCEDLGLSGSLGEDRRPGLKALSQRVENGEVGAVYLSEGMSRLSRDRDRLLGYKLLKLLKSQKVRIRLLEGIYNPAILRDWENLAADLEDSAEELNKLGIRLGRRRASKAATGRHVGGPVCPGYVVQIEGQRSDGSFIMGKLIPYLPHQEVVLLALTELVRQRSLLKTVHILNTRGIVFPFFEPDYRYMASRSALRCCRQKEKGYSITFNVLKTLATNLTLTGTWHYKDILIENNHEPIIPLDLFLQAYEIASSHKPRGRAAYSEPMEWSGVLFCYQHDAPLKVHAYNTTRRWACVRQKHLGIGPRCLYIENHLLTPPLTNAFLSFLELTPYAQAVLEKLKSQANLETLEENQTRQQESELKTQIANLEKYLGCGDPEREEVYWRLIKEAKRELQMLQKKPVAAPSTTIDIERVEKFLGNLKENWQRYPSRLRNRLVTLLVEEVQLRHDSAHIEATIVWKNGFKQVVTIQRVPGHSPILNHWSPEEDKLLRLLWPSASLETVLAALPGRTESALASRAYYLRLSRKVGRQTSSKCIAWTPAEIEQLRDYYTVKGNSIIDMAAKLGRSEAALEHKILELKMKRPRELCRRKKQPTWQTSDFRVIQQGSSQKRTPL